MSCPWPRCSVSGSPAAALSRRSPGLIFFLLLMLGSAANVRSQTLFTDPRAVRSVSGQFFVTASPQDSPLLHRADLAGDTNLVRLEPALLAVSAERFKLALWSQLGLEPGGPWSRITFVLRPARSVNDEVYINIDLLPNAWSYRVELPDVVTRARFARALSATLLLEIANRNNRDAGHSAELPPWLTDGLARQVLAGESAKVILSSPSQNVEGVMQSRLNSKGGNLDPLVTARRILRDLPALTFDQLCWPENAQMNGDDGGAYLASAQLFVDNLLGLDQGAAKLRNLLARLPGCMNWQTAFFAAFQPDFKRPLDVEKWWSLRVIRFAARAPGPRWTIDASRERLADLLAVPVEFRNDAATLPQHTVVSLQNAIRNFSPEQCAAILEIKRRDFELAQFRMAQPFVALADGYRAAIAGYLGEGKKPSRPAAFGRQVTDASMNRGADELETLKKLDVLDARRREVEAKLDAAPPENLNRGTR